MNMAVTIQRAYPEVEKDEDEYVPVTVTARVIEYYRSQGQSQPNCWPPESPMYAVLHSPGRATNTSQDGGMAARMTSMRRGLARWNRIHEMGAAIRGMPIDYRAVVEATYLVPPMEKPRTVRVAAEKVGISTGLYGKRMAAALAWLQGRLCITDLTQ